MPRDRGLKRAFRRYRCIGALPGIRHRPSDSSTASNGSARTVSPRACVPSTTPRGDGSRASRPWPLGGK